MEIQRRSYGVGVQNMTPLAMPPIRNHCVFLLLLLLLLFAFIKNVIAFFLRRPSVRLFALIVMFAFCLAKFVFYLFLLPFIPRSIQQTLDRLGTLNATTLLAMVDVVAAAITEPTAAEAIPSCQNRRNKTKESIGLNEGQTYI